MPSTFKGFEEVEANLKKIGKEAAGPALRDAMKRAARDIKKDASSRAPVLTGRLRDSIASKLVKAAKGIVQVAVFVRRKGKKKAPHAHLLEFGTPHAPAQPFMRPAFKQADTEKTVAEFIKKRIAKLARKSKRGK